LPAFGLRGTKGKAGETLALPLQNQAKSNPILGISIHQIVFPFAHGDDSNQHKIVANLVDQAIACIAEFDLVAIG
jgi:hypothetical protein